MKKILSIFAAAAMALGLASCSGDLHDVSSVDLSKLQLKGSIFTWAGDANYCFTEDTDGSYYYEFIATASSATFAIDYTNGESDVSDTQKAPQWLTTYRGTALDELNKDFEKSFGESKSSTLYPHNDADCMPLALEAGATYRIIITSGPGNIGCTVKKVADAIPFALVDEDGKTTALSATGATTFEYKFTEKTAGTLKFALKSGTAYYAPASETALDVTVPDTGISGDTTPADEYWTFDYSANVPYKVVVEYNKTTGAISVKVDYDNVFSGFDGIAGYGWWMNRTLVFGEDKNTCYFEFELGDDPAGGDTDAVAAELEVTEVFVALKKGNSWDSRYEAMTGTYEVGDIIKTSTKNLSPDGGPDVRGKVKVTAGKTYRVTATMADDKSVTFVVTEVN